MVLGPAECQKQNEISITNLIPVFEFQHQSRLNRPSFEMEQHYLKSKTNLLNDDWLAYIHAKFGVVRATQLW